MVFGLLSECHVAFLLPFRCSLFDLPAPASCSGCLTLPQTGGFGVGLLPLIKRMGARRDTHVVSPKDRALAQVNGRRILETRILT